MGAIRTVTGEVQAPVRGNILMHEHLTIKLPGSSVDRKADKDRDHEIKRMSEHFRRLHDEFAIDIVVDAGPHDLGRDVEFCASVSEHSGVRIVACTGFFTSTAGILRYWREQSDEAIENFMRGEILEGVFPSGLRCGCIKVASSNYGFTRDELRIFQAAGRVTNDLDVPIITHTDPDWQVNVGSLQVQVLKDAGASPERIAIGHVDGTSNVEWLKAICDTGAFVAIDTFGIDDQDDRRIELAIALVEAGYERHILFSHDAVGVWYEPRGVRPRPNRETGFAHIHLDVLPKLRKAGLSQKQFDSILSANPARLLGVE